MNNFSKQVKKGISAAKVIPVGQNIDEASFKSEGFGSAEPFSYTSSLYGKLMAIIVNLLVLTELIIAMFVSSRYPDEFTPVFFKVFFSLLVPTLIIYFIVKRFVIARLKS